MNHLVNEPASRPASQPKFLRLPSTHILEVKFLTHCKINQEIFLLIGYPCSPSKSLKEPWKDALRTQLNYSAGTGLSFDPGVHLKDRILIIITTKIHFFLIQRSRMKFFNRESPKGEMEIRGRVVSK